MEMLSERYGWTPQEIRDMKSDDINAYLDIISIQNKERERQIKHMKK